MSLWFFIVSVLLELSILRELFPVAHVGETRLPGEEKEEEKEEEEEQEAEEAEEEEEGEEGEEEEDKKKKTKKPANLQPIHR